MKPLPLLLLAAVLAGAPVPAPQTAPQAPGAVVARTVVSGAIPAPSAAVVARVSFPGAPHPLPQPRVSPVRTVSGNGATAGGAPPTAPAAEGGVGTALMAGNIGWAEPDLGIDYLATRFPRGTLVEICGPNACLVRRTNDYGPVASIRPNRIADLAVLDWEYICGLPRTRGLCPGTVETVAEIALPATDTEAP